MTFFPSSWAYFKLLIFRFSDTNKTLPTKQFVETCSFFCFSSSFITKNPKTKQNKKPSAENLTSLRKSAPNSGVYRLVGWLLNVPATCKCISGTDLHNFMCCHTEIEAADQTFHLTQSQYTDTGPTSPSADPITPGAWQGSHWSANV